MKTDTEAAMLELDQILRANELTMAVTAALPAMLVTGLCCWGIYRFVSPAPPHVRSAAGPLRIVMAELERVLDEITLKKERLDGDGTAAQLRELQQLNGLVLVNIAKIRSKARVLYDLSHRSITGIGDSASWSAEWLQLEADLLAMAANGDTEMQTRIARRMHRTYLVFRVQAVHSGVFHSSLYRSQAHRGTCSFTVICDSCMSQPSLELSISGPSGSMSGCAPGG
eukprot:TRINITY_DN12737_c1_g1_i1.p1 TRINITY_DN12737_c1_g1~~TRINITY_DN12737_c1_g1_i1.p1  ORF type:complete len:226 (-),score=19.76 TRINITY_DN12737_c1_g1_i1:39-716(-)